MRAGSRLLQAGHAKRDVVGERVGKQERLLRHEADHAAQLGQRDVADIPSVDEHGASRRVLQTRQQVHQRRLPEPVAPTIATVSPAFTEKETSLSTSRVAVEEAEVPELDRA